ncbi:P4 alpha zinc-binding domain-containing protein, partial [Candidatus Magnetomorum sp. HK-1]
EVNGNGYQLVQHDSLKFFCQNGIWLYKWWSRDGEVGDSIQYLQRYHNMNFIQAVKVLLNKSILHLSHHEYSPEKRKGVNGNVCQSLENWRTKNWQLRAERLIWYGINNISSHLGEKSIRYLIKRRGLRLKTIRKYCLGWLPAKNNMPSKLVIPCYSSKGKLIRVRFRIDESHAGEGRYRLLKGSNFDMPFPLGISPKKPVIIVESDLDGMLISQESDERIGVLCLGSTSIELKPEVINYLNKKIPFVLISMDNDKSGREKAEKLKCQLIKVLDWPVAEKLGKDPGEVWKQMNMKLWIESGIKKYEKANKIS